MRPAATRRGWAPGLAAVALAATGAVASWLGPARPGHEGALAISLPMPPAPAAVPAPTPPSGPPVAIDPALVEATPLGSLPRIAADGRAPWRHYARQGDPPCRQACVTVIVTGLGLAREATARALDLPGAVGLAFSPYADGLADWQARARAAGHEALLELPLEPRRFPEDDPGPLAIPLAGAPEAQAEALARALATGAGYLAVTAPAGAFATEPARFAPLARALSARGLGFVEQGGASLRTVAGEAALPYLAGAGDGTLEQAEGQALGAGRALVTVPLSPLALERLAAWLAALPGKRIALTPPGAALAAAAGPTRIDQARAP